MSLSKLYELVMDRSIKNCRLGTTDQERDDEVLSSGSLHEGRGWFWEMIRRLGWHEGLYFVCCGKRENGLWCDWQVSDLVSAEWRCLSIKCYQEEALDKEQVWGRRWTLFWTSWIGGTCGWSRCGYPVDSWRQCTELKLKGDFYYRNKWMNEPSGRGCWKGISKRWLRR